MPEFSEGGIVEGSFEPEPPGCTYYTPGYLPARPDSDWLVAGRRYRVTRRVATDDGENLTLEPVGADPALGYAALRDSR